MAASFLEFISLGTHLFEGPLSFGGSDDSCCSAVAVPWKTILEILVATGIAIAVTYYLTVEMTTRRLASESEAKLGRSIAAIYSAIADALRAALVATGDSKAGAAQDLYKVIVFYLGPLLAFMGPIGAAVKALDEAGKGEVAQELVCIGFSCDSRSPAGAHPAETHGAPAPHATPPGAGPTASAAAAGGGAAAATAGGQTIIITGGGHGGGHDHGRGSSGPSLPPRRIACDCGKGERKDYVAPEKATLKRPMTYAEKNAAARAAIEQFAEVWREDTVTRQLRDIVRALSEVPGRRNASKDVSGIVMFRGQAEVHKNP